MQQQQRYLWLLDAGHAPNTPGKRSPALPMGLRLHEWQLNRDIVRRLAQRLHEEGLAFHVLTPQTQYDLGPTDRARLANEVAARIPLPCRLVSVHSNADGNGDDWTEASGITCLHWPDSEASRDMAQTFQTALVSALGWRDRGIKGRDDLSLLRRSAMPAIITESGFYTHASECRSLLQTATRADVVDGHLKAIFRVEQA